MSEIKLVPPEAPALLEFSGPDAVRFLNGQITQDVRRVVGTRISLPACVTDAKGRLQFRITIHEADRGALWVAGPAGLQEALGARLTRYLIADDVEVADLTGKFQLFHFAGPLTNASGFISRESNRYGVAGTDCWLSSGARDGLPPHVLMTGDEVESFRIRHGVPVWGRELLEGMLPPEAYLDLTDISYQKGCYVGQEVISRIKSAGKVNRRLTCFTIAADALELPAPLVDSQGANAGELTSVSPLAVGGSRDALGYLKRGAGDGFFKTADGSLHPAVVRSSKT